MGALEIFVLWTGCELNNFVGGVSVEKYLNHLIVKINLLIICEF